MIDHPELAEARRPGILNLCHRVQAKHPDWSRERCVAEAKNIYHRTFKDTRDVLIPRKRH